MSASQQTLSALVEPRDIGYASFIMQTFHTETVVEKDGKLHLDHVPFSEGQAVHVFVSTATPARKDYLKGFVLKYDPPLAPVAEEDWEERRGSTSTATFAAAGAT